MATGPRATTVVLYHAGCQDGWGAAWAASTALGRGEDVAYLPAHYNAPLPPAVAADGPCRRLFLLDYSLPRATMEAVAGRVDELVCLDHHQTAAAQLAGLDGSAPGLRVVFDRAKCGAVLAWEHFRPGEPVPELLRHVQDRDLWTWTLPDSRAVDAAMGLVPRTFAAWDDLARQMEDPVAVAELAVRGEPVLAYQAKVVAGLVGHAALTRVGRAGWVVPVVNTPVLTSEVGEALCVRYPHAPFAATFFVRGGTDDRDNIIADMDRATEIWSLRSRGTFDVSAVARELGGGGQAQAAGFARERHPAG